MRTGTIRSVIIYDYKLAKEVMGRPDFADRPSFFGDFSLDEQKKGGKLSTEMSSTFKEWHRQSDIFRRFLFPKHCKTLL